MNKPDVFIREKKVEITTISSIINKLASYFLQKTQWEGGFAAPPSFTLAIFSI
jgi:hypothetical protein